jgi:hypothetical protein
VSDPSNPESLGVLSLSTSNSVALSGDRAFVAAGADGLRVFDIGDRANPTEVAFFVTQGEANDVAVVDNLAYVVASDGLYVIETPVATSVEEIAAGPEPDSYVLHQNYPNPFNPTTTITYDLPEVTDVRLTVHDALGRTVETFDTWHAVPGTHSVQFDASNLPSGVYFYRLEAGRHAETKSLIVFR